MDKPNAFLANVLVEAVPVTTLAERVARAANGFSGKSFQFSLNLRRNIFVESSVRANFFILKTAHRVQVRVDDGLVAGVAAVRADIVLGAVAAAHAIFVAGHALT